MVVALVELGCGWFRPDVHIVVENVATVDLEAVTITLANVEMELGDIPPGAHKSLGPLSQRLPETVGLEWHHHGSGGGSIRVDLRTPSIAAHKDGDLVLSVKGPGQVAVTFEPR